MACSDVPVFLGSLDLRPWEKSQGQGHRYTLVMHQKIFVSQQKFLPYLKKCGFGSGLILEKKKAKTDPDLYHSKYRFAMFRVNYRECAYSRE